MKDGKISLNLCKKLVFSDPYACMIFQRERMEDIGEAQNFRVKMAQYKCGEEEARKIAKKETFDRVCIFGLGTTGMFIGALKQAGASYVRSAFDTKEELADAIKEKLGGTATVFIGSSGAAIEHEIAFQYGVLGCNGIYNSFSLGPEITVDTMPFGFKNQVIFGSINFRQDHMEEAIQILQNSCYDEIVELIDKDEFTEAPIDAYENKIYAKGAPMKTAVIWNEKYVDRER